jgi:outer membrane protein assembly factor BamB
VVYFGSDDHFFYAVDIATHQLMWKFETGDLVRSRPAAADGLVYFTSDDNYLYALEAQTGKEVWRFDMGKGLHPRGALEVRWDYMQSSPAIAEGIVYVGSANPNFYAVDARTGQEKWRFKASFYVRSSPAVVDGVVYFGDWDRNVYALDAQTGQEKWSFDTGSSVVPSPTVVDGVVYIGSKAPCVFALDAQSGQKIWCFPYPASIAWVESSAAVADGVVYVGSSDWRRLNAIDAATGQLKWYIPTKGFPWCSPAVADGVVYIGATGGYFYAVDAETGQELWRVETGKSLVTVAYGISAGVVSSPTVVDGVVYFGSLDGNLYAVSTAP